MAPRFHVNTSPSKTLVVVPALFLSLATLAVILRFRSRTHRKQPLLLDDWLCTAGLILSYGCYTSIVVSVVYGGLGRTITSLQPGNIPTVFKALTSVSVLWATTVATIQMAILSLYTRIFKVIKWHRYTCYFSMVLVFCWWASTFVTMLTTCIPIESFWNPMIHGKCIKLTHFCIASGLTHVFLDVFILSFPLPIIWRLKTNRGNKITITAAILIGLFATIGGLLRMDCLIPILDYNEQDFTESAWIGVLFQILENACGVICSCAPMLATYTASLGNTAIATSIRRFITTNLSRISHGSGNSANSHRSQRSARSGQGSAKLQNPTIGSWRVNQIKKESTFGFSEIGGEGESQEYLSEPSQTHVEGGGRSVDIEMDTFPASSRRGV